MMRPCIWLHLIHVFVFHLAPERISSAKGKLLNMPLLLVTLGCWPKPQHHQWNWELTKILKDWVRLAARLNHLKHEKTRSSPDLTFFFMFRLPSHVKIFNDTTKTYINIHKYDQTFAALYRLVPNLTTKRFGAAWGRHCDNGGPSR